MQHFVEHMHGMYAYTSEWHYFGVPVVRVESCANPTGDVLHFQMMLTPLVQELEEMFKNVMSFDVGVQFTFLHARGFAALHEWCFVASCI